MLTNLDVASWPPLKVRDWLIGLCDDTSWLKVDKIIDNCISGDQLLMMGSHDLEMLGASKVNVQEYILEAIERLRFYNFNMTKDSLLTLILRLACQSRSLQNQLSIDRQVENLETKAPKNIILSADFRGASSQKSQRVSLDTLASVSGIICTVRQITDMLSYLPFSKHVDYRKIKTILLAVSIELTSTAQRDQFVERPNDIVEKISKNLAEYCDSILEKARDPLLVQPFYLESVRIRKNPNETDFGIVMKTPDNNTHIIDKILPQSPAKKINRLSEGDEVLQYNQNIIGWSPKNVERLVDEYSRTSDIILMVKKRPCD